MKDSDIKYLRELAKDMEQTLGMAYAIPGVDNTGMRERYVRRAGGIFDEIAAFMVGVRSEQTGPTLRFNPKQVK